MLDRISDSFAPEDDRAEALLEESCRYIVGVHGVQGQARYTFHYRDLGPGVNGQHLQNEYVAVSTGAEFPILAFIHEVGHVLDGVFLNSAQLGVAPEDSPLEYASDMAKAVEGSASEGETLLCKWLAAVRMSTRWKNLNAALREPSVTPSQAIQLAKLLNVRELWARSYELYIARRDKAGGIARQMDVECRETAKIGSVLVGNYWQGEDFDAVAAEQDEIFRRLGWLIA